MKVAFYAPMKSPNSPRPSGDRRIANLFIQALKLAGFEIELASELRSWEGKGDTNAQELIRLQANQQAEALIKDYRGRNKNQRPNAWFSYHIYHKAPDWIGPKVAAALNIPYFIAEASVAKKQQGGNWQSGFDQSIASAKLARRIFNLNPNDIQGLTDHGVSADKIISIRPFLDHVSGDVSQKNVVRQRLARRFKITPDQYWLLTVAMMREDSKLASYQQLANTISQLKRKDWQLLIIGDGAAELLVRDCFAFDHDRQIHFLGKRDAAFIREMMLASDLFLWPAINEAIGMVALEALSAGLPCVCGASGGIDQIVSDGKTGKLVAQPELPETSEEFALHIESLLDHPNQLAEMAAASIIQYEENHQLSVAANILKTEIDNYC